METRKNLYTLLGAGLLSLAALSFVTAPAYADLRSDCEQEAREKARQGNRAVGGAAKGAASGKVAGEATEAIFDDSDMDVERAKDAGAVAGAARNRSDKKDDYQYYYDQCMML